MNQELPIIEEHLLPDLSIFHVLRESQADLLLIAALCGLSALFVLLWWLVVQEHLDRTNTSASEPHGPSRRVDRGPAKSDMLDPAVWDTDAAEALAK